MVTNAAGPAACPLPLKKGTQWTYEGKVEWTMENSAKVLSTNVHWVTEVVDVVQQGTVQASVVRGLPDELACYEPNRMPGFAVLVNLSNRLYRVPANSEQEAKKLAHRLANAPSKPLLSSEEWLVFPLAKGKRWGGDNLREDNNCCWYVQGWQAKHLRVEGYPAKQPADVWTLTYRTNPDHQIVDIVAGLGITRYVYAHHGTVASADVRLVSFRL